MLALVLLLVGVALPASAFAFPPHSGAREAFGTGVFWWTLVWVMLAWVAAMNYSFSTRVNGTTLRAFTIRGWQNLELQRLNRIRSLSLWGQFGSTHTLRLHTDDGRHVTVVANTPFTARYRSNMRRAAEVREALLPYAGLADARGRWWLGAGPRPSRTASARHLLAMLALYMVGVIALLVVMVAYLAAALD